MSRLKSLGYLGPLPHAHVIGSTCWSDRVTFAFTGRFEKIAIHSNRGGGSYRSLARRATQFVMWPNDRKALREPPAEDQPPGASGCLRCTHNWCAPSAHHNLGRGGQGGRGWMLTSAAWCRARPFPVIPESASALIRDPGATARAFALGSRLSASLGPG